MLYGTVKLVSNGKTWVVRCEPHVRARLKRTFPRAPQQAGDSIAISNTPENSRDLEWFLQRYPMEIQDPELLAAASRTHRQQEARIAELMTGHLQAPLIDLAEPPREYQAIVPDWLQAKGGLLLGDDVGLGKTISAICCAKLPGALPAVVVAPSHLLRHWRKFFFRFAPGVDTKIVLHGDPVRVLGKRTSAAGMADVFLISYHRLKRWADILGQFCRLVIYEECQQLRRSGTQIHAACSHLSEKVNYRLGLSATPIFNYGSEFFWVADTLQPGCLGTREEFVREWCTAGGAGDKARLSDPTEFGAYLRREGIMLRRTRKEVGRELPHEPQKIVHEIDSDATVLEKLTGDAVELAKIILRSNERFRGEKMHAAGEFDALIRQATGIAKAPYVAEFVRLLLENGEKVVLFLWHRAVYDILLEKLKDLNPVMYTGSESASQKEKSLDAFKSGRSPLILMSLRAGAGVDGLQFVSRTAVFGELDWSPAVHHQNIGRVDRDGQEDPVTAYFLVSNDGADPIMLDVLGIKKEQSDGVMNPDGALTERADTGEHNLRQLARAFLKGRGIETPEDRPPTSIRQDETDLFPQQQP